MTTIRSDASADKPETEQMLIIHHALRHEFALLPVQVAAVPPGNRHRAAWVAAHAHLMLSFLHDHHTSEDLLLWPPLRQRVPLEAPLIETMERQPVSSKTSWTCCIPR